MDERIYHFSFLCPSCHQSVIASRDLFALAAAPCDISCPCGKSSLHIDFQPQRITMQVPCLVCQDVHRVSCPSHTFLKESTLCFTCAVTGIECLCIGDEDAAYAATVRMEKAADKLPPAEEKNTFLDELIMHEVLSELKDIASRGGIGCTCGCHEYSMQIGYASVTLCCDRCNSHLRIPAATAEDLEELCVQYTLTIKEKTT